MTPSPHFTWIQDSGSMIGTDGQLIQQLYAGHADGLNNPDMQSAAGKGPLPCGWYTIGPTDAVHVTSEGHTLYDSAALIPDADNEMFGRSGFRIHGRKSSVDMEASNGCIILDHGPRMQVLGSSVKRLQVVRSATVQ